MQEQLTGSFEVPTPSDRDVMDFDYVSAQAYWSISKDGLHCILKQPKPNLASFVNLTATATQIWKKKRVWGMKFVTSHGTNFGTLAQNLKS